MKAVDSKSIALFFFFALLDEKKAISATSKALKLCRGSQAKFPEIPINVHIIRASTRIWNKYHSNSTRGRQNLTFSGDWTLPKTMDLNPWKEFQKSADEDELIALIWSKILNFRDEEIAEALQLSIGTVRFRVSNALSKLGTAALHPGAGQKRRNNLGLVKN